MGSHLKLEAINNLNYTASIDALIRAVSQANIQTVVSSRRFLKQLSARGISLDPLLNKVSVIYLEDMKTQIKQSELLLRYIAVKCLPKALLKMFWLDTSKKASDNAAILFSSGSEGQPKGVQLSHQNILANCRQVADVLNIQDDERMMVSLPLFHAFGLTVTQFMPLIEGLPMVCHPDPTDVLPIAKAVAKYNVSVMCGTSTFLRLYCRNNKVHPLMLNSLRVVVSGAERLNPDVRQAFKAKFNKDIYEGYGATETSPVATVNLPDVMDYSNYKVQQGGKVGSVGMPLPGTSLKIVDPETFEVLPVGEAGMVLIAGVQVMQGYLKNPVKNQQVIKDIDGLRWYVTGDKGSIDEDGYLTIIDRYSRFAKVAGEMVSLTAVEQVLAKVLALNSSDHELVAVALSDTKKGEVIAVLGTLPCSLADVRQAMVDNQCNPLLIPNRLITLEALQLKTLPKLGSGKTDYQQIKQLLLQQYKLND